MNVRAGGDGRQSASTPKLVITVELEGRATARIFSTSFGGEVRLRDDLESRRNLRGEVLDALEFAIEILRARAAGVLPGDLREVA